MKSIYTVTVLSTNKDRIARCFGWFDNFDYANKVVTENIGDIAEGGIWER